MVQELGLPAGEIGELVINGWHVNTFHVSYTMEDVTTIICACAAVILCFLTYE